MPTLKDVAVRAQVSASTVSLVLNGRDAGRVKPAISARVREVAAEMGYVPNRLAAGLRRQRSQVIGFVSDEIATTPFAGRLLLGAQEAAQKHDWLLMMVNSGGDAELEAREIGTLLQYQVEGLIYARMYHQKVTLPPIARGVPLVLVDASTDEAAHPSIVPDEEQIARSAVEHLLAHGHSRIGYVSNVDDILASHGRRRGYEQALTQAGLSVDPSLIVSATTSAASARTVALDLLDRPDRPTAVFCFNDQMAMGTYQAATSLGLHIPQDLSVVGVDNLEIVAAALHPGLTTVALPHYEMGQWAVDRLAEILASDPAEPRSAPQVRLECSLVERHSVVPPP